MKKDSTGRFKKPYDTVACKFRGIAIECPREDFRSGYCDVCGWNPLIEADRIKEIKDGTENV